MTIYLIFFWLFALSAIIMELDLSKRTRVILFILSYLLLLFFVGLRWETGNDWAEYYVYYTHLSSLQDNPPNNTFEIGYRIFSLGIRHLGLSYSGFLLIYSAIYLGLIFLSFKRDNYRVAGWLILQLYAPFIMGLMGTARQVFSVAICMFSVRYILSRDWKRFVLCVAVAATFHVSAIAFLAAWPIARVRITVRRLVVLVVIIATLSLLHVGNFLAEGAGELIGKFNAPDLAAKFLLEQQSSSAEFRNAAGDLTTWYIVVRLATLFVFLLSYPLFSEESDRVYFKLYLTGFCLLFVLSGAVFVLAERTALYFTIFQMHLLAILTRRLKMPVLRHCYCAGLIALSLVRLYTGLNFAQPKVFIPYKGVVINRDVERDLGWFQNDL